jgi:hypothetical protein
MNETLEIIQGISQALSNKHDGALDEDGNPIEIGLRREKQSDFREKKIMDGFSATMQGNTLKVLYHGEISLKEVHKRGFENKMIGLLEDCVSYLKSEYKKVAKKALKLEMVGEPKVFVEHQNKIRSWVKVSCVYEISGIKVDKELSDDWRKRLSQKTRKWLGVNESED